MDLTLFALTFLRQLIVVLGVIVPQLTVFSEF